VDATHLLTRVATAIQRHDLDAVLIGNAGAAMHGAPVTTIDFDFLVRRTPRNRKKLAGIAADLSATLYRPFYPASRVLRLMNDDESLQVDFLDEAAGVRSFEGVRKRAHKLPVGGAAVRVADLADIIKMKRATDRPRDRAVLEILEKTLEAISSANPQAAPRRAQKAK
jgi:hypothetical protein